MEEEMEEQEQDHIIVKSAVDNNRINKLSERKTTIEHLLTGTRCKQVFSS